MFIDPTEIAEVIRMGINRQGKTVTKVIFLSVGTRIKIYQARTAMRGQALGIFLNEDLTKYREKLNFMCRILFREKSIFKNWTFLGKVYLKHANEGEVIEITKRDDLKKYDTNKKLDELGLYQ